MTSKELIRHMIAKGFTDEEIAATLGVPEREALAVRAQMRVETQQEESTVEEEFSFSSESLDVEVENNDELRAALEELGCDEDDILEVIDYVDVESEALTKRLCARRWQVMCLMLDGEDKPVSYAPDSSVCTFYECRAHIEDKVKRLQTDPAYRKMFAATGLNVVFEIEELPEIVLKYKDLPPVQNYGSTPFIIMIDEDELP